jgi:hypothetical protein
MKILERIIIFLNIFKNLIVKLNYSDVIDLRFEIQVDPTQNLNRRNRKEKRKKNVE